MYNFIKVSNDVLSIVDTITHCPHCDLYHVDNIVKVSSSYVNEQWIEEFLWDDSFPFVSVDSCLMSYNEK